MTNQNIDWLDHLPADQRLAGYLDDLLASENHEEQVSALATALKYTRPQVVKSWITGVAKVPLKALLPIAQHTGRDVSELIPLFVAQEMKDADGDRLYQASKRCISAWEWGLIAVARDIYQGDE
jgi:hypothetical protein